MTKRLNTDELIQDTRQIYEAAKLSQRIEELQLTLELRDKELEYLVIQIASSKEESKGKVSRLERELVELKTQMGAIKLKSVREARQLQEKHKQEIRRMNKEYELAIEQRLKDESNKYQTLIEVHNDQVRSLQQKYDSYAKFQKQESEDCKNVSQQQSYSFQSLVTQLQEEKKNHLIVRKDAERRADLYKDALQKLKAEFQGLLEEKDQNLAALKGVVEGLKLKESFLEQKIQQMQGVQLEVKSQDSFALEQLKQINCKLTRDNDNLKERLRQKEEETLLEIKQNESHTSQINFEPYHCSHIGLIAQLETNLQLKEKQIEALRAVVSQWTQAIGFDRPLSQRLSELAEKSQNAEGINKSWLQNLKEKSKKGKAGLR